VSPSKSRLFAAGVLLTFASVAGLSGDAFADGRKRKPTADAHGVSKPGDAKHDEAEKKPVDTAKGDKREGAKESKDAHPKDAKDSKGKKGKRKKAGSIPLGEKTHHLPSLSIQKREIKCPDDMVAVAGRVCVDRYESSLVEADHGELISSYYPPSAKLAQTLLDKWTTERDAAPEGSLSKTMLLPDLPEVHRTMRAPKAMSWPGSIPNGYVTGEMAENACKNSGKRLCSEREWVTACRGETQTQFPYGDKYKQDACNVFREDHPASILHGSASQGHSDPRLNLVDSDGKPLLRVTGGTPGCVSKWGEDGIHDMVGNLDEWIDDRGGTFVGGFYSRATRSGCDARVQNHAYSYFDYSTGVRCCKDP
jgi:hypothetical protein